MLRRILSHAEVAGLVGVKPHEFRRFVGTQLAAGDIRKAQKALGHKRIEGTARHYELDELEPGSRMISTERKMALRVPQVARGGADPYPR